MRLSKLYKILSALYLSGIGLALISCDRDNNSPGYIYFPDMTYSRAYESYSENPNFSNNSTLREPVEGTVPRDYVPLPYTKDLEDRDKAGRELKNPLEANEENLARGQVLFERFCLQCHGELGDGQGYLYTSKLYPFPPASLINEKVSGLPDGQIFHTITYGYGVMAEHGSIIRSNDRWKIIQYIRNNLQNQEP